MNNIELAAYNWLFSRIDGSLRSLLKSCQVLVRYEKINQGLSDYNEYRREFCLICPNYSVFQRISKRLEMLIRRINALMPETSIVLLENDEAFFFYDAFCQQIVWDNIKSFSVEQTQFCCCSNPLNFIYFVTPEQRLKKEKRERVNDVDLLSSSLSVLGAIRA